MKTFDLYLWMNHNLPCPYEIQRLYRQLGKEISNDEAWFVCHLHDVRCTGPYGAGFTLFEKQLGKYKLLPSHKSAEQQPQTVRG